MHEVTLRTTVKEVAEKLLKEAHEDAQRESVGLIPAAFTRKAKRRPITELFEEYLESVRKNGRTTDHVRVVKLRFLALAKGCRWACMADVTSRSFMDWRNAQTAYQARTLNNYYEAARAFFNWVDRAYEIPNPLKRVENLAVPVKYPQGPRAFTETELLNLFGVARPKRRFFYRVMSFTGLRRKEAKRLCWGDVHLDDKPGLFLRAEATKARRADWLPILTLLVPELREARPENWRANMLVFPRGVADPDTLRRDMVKAGIPLIDKLGRPVGIHTFRRTFISQLQKAGVHPRVIMQLARHKSLRLTDSTYTDTTLLPLAEGIESLAPIAKQIVIPISPRSSPRFSGQNGVSVSKAVQVEKPAAKDFVSEVIESEDGCHALAHAVQPCPNSDLVPGVGVEPTRL
ncbi:MAG TPA: site-specific integrase [Lacunisphaera sp.]|nr:site-specific integrase [Lacunisphaera sp.]